ncbi:MAG: hypothetical protein HKN13_13795 [Rhodothermales bacterium]|nr:hypothetical protein [Rhodothermales bacterium]
MGGLARLIDNKVQHGAATLDEGADQLLESDGNALLIGILLDQRIKAEMAFTGPLKMRQRLGHLDMRKISKMDLEKLQDVFREKPAVHSFANMMAGRVQELAQTLVDEYKGDGANLWSDGSDLKTIQKRLGKIKGFGPSKCAMVGDALDLFGHRSF